MLKNILPEHMQPYGLVHYKSRWYITTDGQGCCIHVYKTKREALEVVERLYTHYKQIKAPEE